jgi:uncharacterized protein YdcH (DUF465 family)
MNEQTQASGEPSEPGERDELHRLADQHHELEGRLHALTEKHYLSEPEQVEEVTIKKRKLQLKDRMEDLRRHL